MKIRYNDFLGLNEAAKTVITLSELEKVIKTVFDDTKVSSVNTTYEKMDKGDYKFIVTMNNIYYEKTDLIHTKLIFYTDKDKRKLKNNYFHYLFDINCKFRKVNFVDSDDLQNKLNNIFDKRIFGKDLKTLSDLSVTIVTRVNKWLKDNGIDTVSLYNISYNPIVDVIPCESLFFKFDINIDDTRFIKMNIRKIDNNEYKLSFNENDWFLDITVDDLKAIPQTIGGIVKKYII